MFHHRPDPRGWYNPLITHTHTMRSIHIMHVEDMRVNWMPFHLLGERFDCIFNVGRYKHDRISSNKATVATVALLCQNRFSTGQIIWSYWWWEASEIFLLWPHIHGQLCENMSLLRCNSDFCECLSNVTTGRHSAVNWNTIKCIIHTSGTAVWDKMCQNITFLWRISLFSVDAKVNHIKVYYFQWKLNAKWALPCQIIKKRHFF